MEKFPNFVNKTQESDPWKELKRKVNIAILYGSISLTALVAVGCGSKKAGGQEGASRFPRAEEVVKNEKERDALLNKALDDISFHRFNFESDGSLIIELNGAKWRLQKKDVDSLKDTASSRLTEPNASKLLTSMNYQSLAHRLKLIIPAEGELLNTNEVKMTETEKTEGGTRTKTRIIERNTNNKKETDPKGGKKIYISPDFDDF